MSRAPAVAPPGLSPVRRNERGLAGTALRPRRGNGQLPAILLFLPPALLLFTIFVVLPIAEAAWYSGFNWNGFGRPTN